MKARERRGLAGCVFPGKVGAMLATGDGEIGRVENSK